MAKFKRFDPRNKKANKKNKHYDGDKSQPHSQGKQKQKSR